MALDSLTITRVADGEDVLGSHQRLRVYDVVPSNSYPSGGYTITPKRFGLTKIRAIFMGRSNTAAVGYIPWYNSETGKLMIIGQAGALVDVTANTDLSTYSYRLWFLGE